MSLSVHQSVHLTPSGDEARSKGGFLAQFPPRSLCPGDEPWRTTQSLLSVWGKGLSPYLPGWGTSQFKFPISFATMCFLLSESTPAMDKTQPFSPVLYLPPGFAEVCFFTLSAVGSGFCAISGSAFFFDRRPVEVQPPRFSLTQRTPEAFPFSFSGVLNFYLVVFLF